jgi:hypothetical protein
MLHVSNQFQNSWSECNTDAAGGSRLLTKNHKPKYNTTGLHSWGFITHTDSSSWHLKLKCWQLSSTNVTCCHFCCSILKIMGHGV